MNLEDCDFIKSDYCTECCGDGYFEYAYKDTGLPFFEQCEFCEDLHLAEVRADIRHDMMKGD
jgi:hypothetical protein